MAARRRAWWVAVAIAVPAVLVSSGVGAGADHNPRHSREEVRRRQAELAGELDVLRADGAEVAGALDALNANVAGQARLLDDARRQVAAAEQALAEARAAEEATQEQIALLQRHLQELAVDSFMGGGPSVGVETVLGASDPVTATRSETMLGLVVSDATDVADELRAAEQDLEVARRQAEDATAQAEARRDEATGRLAELQAARDAQAAFAVELEGRIEARLSEAAGLQRIDQQLATRIANDEAELARRARAVAGTRGTTRAPAPRNGGGGGPVGSLVSVGGITVAASIAENLAALLDAARADGINFGGGGYRDPSDQERLRRQNCAAPVNWPASSCSPPTARPGQSMHERGLAVDFTYNGSLIQGRGNPGFRWLAANAGRFGFSNLPSEPWHWSTNGQ